GRPRGDIVNCESDPGKLGSLSVSSYSPYSTRAIHYVPLGPQTKGLVHYARSGNSNCRHQGILIVVDQATQSGQGSSGEWVGAMFHRGLRQDGGGDQRGVSKFL